MRRAQQLAVPTIAQVRANSTKASTHAAPGKWALSASGDVPRSPRPSPIIQKWPSARPARPDDTRDARPRSPLRARTHPSPGSLLGDILRPLANQSRRAGPNGSSSNWNPRQEGPSKRPAYRAELRPQSPSRSADNSYRRNTNDPAYARREPRASTSSPTPHKRQIEHLDNDAPSQSSLIAAEQDMEQDIEPNEDQKDRSTVLDEPEPETLRGESNKAAQRRAFRLKEKLAQSVAQEKGHTSSTNTTAKQVKPIRLKPVKALSASRRVFIPEVTSVANLSRLLGLRQGVLQRKMKQAGMGELSYDHILRSDDASLLAMELGFDPIVDDEAAFDLHPLPPHPDVANLPERPPVVTIMGHVDHGKTTLLDTLRSSSVAKGESGGITQHIGAFSVNVPGTSQSGARTITFLDTPGHAAFSAMRARGARMTDIVVLVVAADDGVMPQTKEVINLIKKDEGNIGVVVAINKVDKPGVDVEKIEKALLAEGLELETFGGEVPVVHVSGLTGQGLDLLIENISALAELQELRSDVEGQAQGYIVESRMQKGLGPVATVLLLRGSLKPQSHIISGFVHAKVRQMTDANGKVVKLAQPGMAITVAGWKSLPAAGDEVLEGEEHDIKRAIINRVRRADLAAVVEDAEAINVQRQLDREKRQKELLKVSTKTRTSSRSVAEDRPTEDLQKELRLVIKCDVSGSVEAVVGALEGIGNKHAKVKIVSSGVGDVTESDVLMAKTSEALIVAFSVSTPRAVEAMASASDIQIIESPIIYRLMEDVTSEVIKLLPPIIEQRVTGEASVLQIFEIQLKGKQTMKVAGCRVTNGSLEKSRKARVVRAGNAIFEGNIETFRHLKKDVLEAKRGTECGISLQSFNDLRADDVIQCIEILEKPGKL